MLWLLVNAALLLGAQGASTSVESTEATNYVIESHNVTTEDGYILGLRRIPHGVNTTNSGSKKVVFLMHGLTFGSNSFTYAGPKYAIAYLLADAGYDVWMGNARGNAFSRNHVSLDPDVDKLKFFDFDYEDIALYDLPAMFDYMLNKTKQDKFYYMGYSQGGSVFYALNSRSSAYHSKIAAAYILAGIGYENYFPNTNITLVSQSVDVLYNAALLSGDVELAPSNLTSAVIEILVGAKAPPGFIVGAAGKQLLHYLQNIRDKRFRSWDLGSTGNEAKYGSVLPPAFDLSKINIPVNVYYSLGDITQSEDDAIAMVKAMPNATGCKVARNNFSHIDYMASKDAKDLFINDIIDSIKQS